MKKLIVLSASILAGIISCTAQKTQDRTATPFDKLKVSGSVVVVYTNSDSLALRVEADEKEIERVETKVENGILYIENKGNFKEPVKVYVYNNHLSRLEASGATDVKTTNAIKGDSLSISLTGASHVSLNSEAPKLNCIQGGASNLVLNGRADELNVAISGASTFKGYGLNTGNANVVATGASTAKVFATNKLRASASGASSVKIKGDPKEVSAEATPAASVTRVNKQSASNDNKSGGDTITYNWKGKKVLVIKGDEAIEYKTRHRDHDASFKHWAGFSMGVNGYLNSTAGITVPKQYNYMELNYSRSFNFQFNLFERQFDLVKNNVKLVTGLGFDYHIYALSNNTNLVADSSFTWGVIDASNKYSYKTNKLRCTYLQVPLLLEFNTSNNPDKTFHIAIGAVAQYLISSRTKQELEENKNELTKVRKDTYNMSPFAAKAHVNIGYRGWTVFGEYSLVPLFEKGKGPELYPFTAGVRIVPFT